MTKRLTAMISYLNVLKGSPDPAFIRMIDAAETSGNELTDWRQVKYQLLAATNQGDAVEKALRQWYDKTDKRSGLTWGGDLAQLLAERSAIGEAVEIFKTLAAQDALSADDYRILADWYTILDKRAESREARIQSWQVKKSPIGCQSRPVSWKTTAMAGFPRKWIRKCRKHSYLCSESRPTRRIICIC